jgi:hypothetical protein
VHTSIHFCIIDTLRTVRWAAEHRGRSMALQDPLIAEADLLQSVLAFENETYSIT